ncbi:MAG: hypothetical protein LBC87_11700 [Fibromonadaceae bacterium]|jgi:hypothetical protein|nr:hypothetical protein [Fibromonadaceae bacterium]
MKPINQIVISLTLLALLIGCYKANKIPATEQAQVIAEQQQEIATQQAGIAVQQKELVKEPYIISTKEHLENFSRLVNEGNDFRNQVVKLEANIMLNDTVNWKNWDKKPPADSWVPIGNKEKRFNGIFEGSGYVISGIYINSKNEDQGFFGYLDPNAEVKNLGIVASYIKGTYGIGGLAGVYGDLNQNNSIKSDSIIRSGRNISNSYFRGTVIGERGNIGGLVGLNYGLIVNSHSAGTVKGDGYIGGLVGVNDGTINNCYSSSIVTGVYDVGGLVGRHSSRVIVNSYSSGTVIGAVDIGGLVGYFNAEAIINSYSTASVKGEGSIGGLVGMILDGIVSNSYSSGNVKGIYRTGGLVGYIGGPGSVINSYSNGLVTGGKNGVGGMIGFNKREIYGSHGIPYESVIARSYYDKQTSKQSDKCKYAGKTSAEMKKKATFAGWNFEKIWAINDKINNGYPYLLGSDYIENYEHIRNVMKLDHSRIFRENTCPVESMVITTAKELADFARAVSNGNNFLNKTVVLGANIMLNDTANWKNWESSPPKNKWIPIGTRENRFHGTFNGNGFTIGGIYVNNSKNEQGLFGAIDIKGEVKNLGVVASYIKGEYKVGGIAGINLGKIYNCYFTGMAVGINDVGGIAGESVSYIRNSYSAGIINGSNNVGGIAGSTFKNDIDRSYSISLVTGASNVGGLVGSGKNESIADSYSAGIVKGSGGSTGGLVGFLDGNSSIYHNYSASEVIGIKDFTGGLVGFKQGEQVASRLRNYYDIIKTNVPDGYTGMGKITAEMKQKATFSDWDFESTWAINDTINNGYPYLLGSPQF